MIDRILPTEKKFDDSKIFLSFPTYKSNTIQLSHTVRSSSDSNKIKKKKRKKKRLNTKSSLWVVGIIVVRLHVSCLWSLLDVNF